MKLDYIDIAIHLFIGAAIMAAVLISPYTVPSLLWLAFGTRELLQQLDKGKEWWKWSLQKHLEAWPPGFIALIIIQLWRL